MARVFVDARSVETAIAIREAIQPDGHEVELVEAARQIEGRLGGAGEDALVLTAPPDESVSVTMRALFEAQIPRPPVLGVADGLDTEGRHQLAQSLSLIHI